MNENSKLCVVTDVSALAGYLPHPEHPIYYPDQEPQPPIVEPPIEPPVEPPVNPDDLPHPDHTLPGDLPGGGGGEPIPLPPEVEEVLENWEMKCGWTAETGWVVVLVPTGDQLIPTPSRK